MGGGGGMFFAWGRVLYDVAYTCIMVYMYVWSTLKNVYLNSKIKDFAWYKWTVLTRISYEINFVRAAIIIVGKLLVSLYKNFSFFATCGVL